MIRAAKKVGRHGVRDGAIILLMFRHGLRTAELVALKWTQIDLAGGYIEVQRVKHGRDSIHPREKTWTFDGQSRKGASINLRLMQLHQQLKIKAPFAP